MENSIVADELTVIILAAGKSQRFGSTKMLHPMQNGLTILENTIATYTQVFKNIFVVTRSDAGRLKKRLGEWPVTLIESPNSEKGMSQSLIAGVQSVLNDKGYLIALGDMPYIKESTLKALKLKIKTRSANEIVALQMNNRLGNPVWFGTNFTQELLALTGDNGAKSLLSLYPKALLELEVVDQGIFKDIDTLADVD